MDTFALQSGSSLGALGDDASDDSAQAAPLSDELAIALYEHMVLSRQLDERLIGLQREGAVSHHSSARGEEAAVVGAVAAIEEEDWVFPSSREAAAALWRGMPLAAYACHAMGRAGPSGKGRDPLGPPLWLAAHVVSASPLVGTHIPHAVGLAWAARARAQDVVALVFFGEGATSSGDFHAGLNFAGVSRAPVIAVCRNNGWATSTPASKQTASEGFAVKAVAYGLRGVAVDGSDVIAVFHAVREARRLAADGRGGTLVEAIIPGLDRVDPVARMRSHLEGRGLWSAEREQHLWADVGADVDRALAEASQAERSPDASAFDDVYAELPWHLEEQRRGR